MPRTADGRPLSYVALNGHGAYPRTGFIPRIFLAFNDYTGKGVPQVTHSSLLTHANSIITQTIVTLML